jgi:VanZ family protein
MRNLLAYVPATLWAVVLLWLGSSTNLPATPPVPHLDKVLHFGAYGILGALLGGGWTVAGRTPPWPLLLGLALLLAGLDEYRQSRIVERHADRADWLADALGASAGFYFAAHLVRRSRERRDR